MSQDAQRAPAVQPDSAGHQALRRADPGPATAALGNQATADLAGLDLMHVAAALPAVGNLALGRLLGGGPARPDPLADPDFNPEAVVDRLARAIDSDDVKLVSLPHLDLATGTYVEGVFLRHVDAAAVAAALENLTAAQAEYVSALYAGTEKRPLAQDLFAQGNSGYPSDLPKDAAARMGALLHGTRPERAAPAGGPVAPQARIDADAAEVHQLLAHELDERARERIMALHRREVPEIERLDGAYTRLFDLALGAELGERLTGLQPRRPTSPSSPTPSSSAC